jgi:actin-related protein
MDNSVIVLDNGAATIKVGVANQSPKQSTSQGPRIVPNAVVRSKRDKLTYFGHEFDACRDYSSLHYRLPFEKVRCSTITCTTRIYSATGLSSRLGRAKGCMGRHLLNRRSWGESRL